MAAEYRIIAARLEFRREFESTFARFARGVDDRGHSDIVREVILEWLCDGASSHEDFVNEAEAAANDHDWPEPDEDEEDAD